eukprot:Skav212995  [mRNA]  locus=scaffold423:334051:337845:- [translate_table: standard]
MDLMDLDFEVRSLLQKALKLDTQEIWLLHSQLQADLLAEAEEDKDMMTMITQGTGFGGNEASVCHFVNLCEDAHDDSLIYVIPPGSTKIKKYEDDDEEVCIKLDGESIKAVHAILESSDSGVSIQAAAEGAVLWVNGNALKGTEKVKLEHGARVILGHYTVLRFVDPAATDGFDEKTGAPLVIDWQYAMAELSKKNTVTGVDVDEEIRKARDT